jgi:metal-responsive CopG/Arc/MetJ family transcriptional regulator
MVTEMISLKLEDKFLDEIDIIVKKEGYQNRTEFIRNALREKVEEAKLKQAMMEIAHLKGASKRKTTEKEYEMMRKIGFEKISKDLK